MTGFHGGRGRRALPRLACLGLALAVAGCDTDELLEVEDPTFASPESLDNPAGLATLYAGALGDFQIAYSGSGGDAYLSVVSLFTDEFHSSDTFTTRTATDQRDQFPAVQGNTSDAAYNRLQYARRSANEVAAAIARVSEDGTADPRYPQVKALEGFAIIALAEAFCSNIPLSESVGGIPGEPGQPLSTEQLLTEAAARFDDALAASSASDVARVGKGRALLNNGDFQAAAAAVAGVPTSFIHFVEHSDNSDRQFNPIFSLMANGRYSVSDQEGGNGLPYRSSGDPRIPWFEDPRGGFDNSIRLFIDLRYPDFGSDVVLADGVEARLIEAEAALQAGDATEWLAILNALRADVGNIMSARYDDYAANVPGPNNPTATLAPLTDPGSAAGRVDLMFSERAFWLYDTGHRLGDMRRLVRDYGRSAESVFPSGAYHKGSVYGPDVNLPLSFNETQNPNFDLEMCNTQQS